MSERTIFSPKDVFISWNHRDLELKNQVMDMILEKGYSVWESDFECAGSIREACLDHIPLCNLFLILITPNSIQSNWVKDELETAMQIEDAANRIIPVVLGVPEGEYGVLTEPMTALWRMTSGIVGENAEALASLKEKIQKNVSDLSMNWDFRVYSEAVLSGRNALCPDYVPRHLTKIVGQEEVEIDEKTFISHLTPAFIFADGGCGKTQFLNRILSEVSKRQPEKLLFKISCTALVGQSDLMQVLYEQFCTLTADSHYEKRHFEALLRYKAKDIVLLVDAADEVGKEYHLTAIGEMIATFRARFKEAICIYTARTETAAKRLLVGETVQKYELKRFSGEDIRRYSFVKFTDREDDANAFYIALSTIDEEIKGNPFLLKWLVEIYQRRGMVPDSVSRILDEVTDIVVGSEDIARHPEMLNDYSDSEKKYIELLPEILKRFAYERYLADYNELKIQSRALMRDVICTYRVPKSEAEDLSFTLLAYTEKRSITVQDQFAHKIFLEYFTACYLYDTFFNLGQVEDEEEIEDYFSDYYFEPYWSNPTLLLLCRTAERAKKAGVKEIYRIACAHCEGDYDLLFRASKMGKSTAMIQKILLEDMLEGTLDGKYAPYAELFCYVPRENLYKPLLQLESDRLPEDTEKKTMVALSLIRDLCYIYGKHRTLKELVKDEEILQTYKDAVMHSPKGDRTALNAMFYDARPDWLKEYVVSQAECTTYPYFFNIRAVVPCKDYGFGRFALDQLYKDELGLYGESRPNKRGKYVGLITLPYEPDRIEKALQRENASHMTGLILTPTAKTVFDRFGVYRSPLHLLCLPPNTASLQAGTLDHCGAGVDKPFSLILPFGIQDFGGALTAIPRLEYVKLPDSMITVSGLKDCKALKTVVFPREARVIGENAFEGCTGLESMDIPEGIERIDHYAFYRCTGLKTLSLPSSLRYVGKKVNAAPMDMMFGGLNGAGFDENIFSGCTSLEEISFAEGIEEIGQGAFVGCVALTHLELPSTLVKIHHSAFAECEGLAKVTLPDSVTYLGCAAFYGCSAMTEITFGEGIEIVPPFACFKCTSLKDIHFPSRLRVIGQRAFEKCFALEEVQFPETLEAIDREGFRRSESLSFVALPESVKYLGGHRSKMFLPNTSSMFGKMMAENEELSASFKALARIEGEAPKIIYKEGVFAGCISLEEVVLPEEMEEVGDYLFDGCAMLRKVKIPNFIRHIGKGMFSRCRWIRSVILPKSFETLGEQTFYGCKLIESVDWQYPHPIPKETFMLCTNLDTLVVGEETKVIGESAFAECRCLEEVHLPQNIKILEDAFKGCIYQHQKKNTRITVSTDVFGDGVADAGVWSESDRHFVEEVIIEEGITEIAEGTFTGCERLTSVTFPSTVKTIGKEAFYGCVSLSHLQLPEGLQFLGESAFSGCRSLVRLELPDSITEMEWSTFSDCDYLEYVKWTAGVPVMPSCVFSGCVRLKTLLLPDNVTTISGLLDCHSLTQLTFPADLLQIEEMRGTGFETLDLPDTVGTLRCNLFGGTFENCKNLRSIRLPKGVARLDQSIFKGCSALSDIVFPERLRAIESFAFGECTSLIHLTLPDSMMKIRGSAFYHCENLESITLSPKLILIEDNAFEGCFALKTVTVRSALRHIQAKAFAGCTKLESIELPSSLEDLGEGAFYGCKALKELVLPDGLYTLPPYCFAACTGLTKIVLPKGLSGMAADCFSGTSPATLTLPASQSHLIELWGQPLFVTPPDPDGQITAVYRE